VHASVCDQVVDIVQNAIEANASQIELRIDERNGQLVITVTDNGKGMTTEQQARALDPFFSERGKHDHRRVGLGLPFLKQMTDTVNGSLEMSSTKGEGTRIGFTMPLDHIDLPPVGSWGDAILGLMTFPGDFDLLVDHRRNESGYAISRSELSEVLGDLTRSENLLMAREFIASNEASL
jgi:hypothetical protein